MTEDNFQKPGGLPENALRSLKPGEHYHRILSADQPFKDVSLWSVSGGIVMA